MKDTQRPHVLHVFLAIIVLVSHATAQSTVPTFVKRLYRGECREGSPIDTEILVVSATEGDRSRLAEVDYSIQDNPWFKIDHTGAIRVKSPIDAENPAVMEHMKYIVTATDRGTPNLSGTTTLSIQIVDRNEARPRWKQWLYFSNVYHGDQPGTQVLTVEAVDRDRDSRLSYDMLQVLNSPYLQIDSESGQITVAQAIDYGEVVQFYNGSPYFQFRARVRDGRYVSIVTVIIRIISSARPGSNELTTVVPASTTPFSGCTIGNQTFYDGERNSLNTCEICRPTENPETWSEELLDLRAGGQATCDSICSHLVDSVPNYLSFVCSFLFDLPAFIIDSICYVKDIDRLRTINCTGTDQTVSRLYAFCDYQNFQAARLDKAVCP